MHKESMTLQQMLEKKSLLGLTDREIAERSGVPLESVQEIFSGNEKSLTSETRQSIEQVLLGAKPVYDPDSIPDADTVFKDNTAENLYDPRQGSYTWEDYLTFPDERRVELIDGYVYDMASPLIVHQLILGALHVQFYPCAEAHPECELVMAPSDVRLEPDDKTVVQPDLYIFCNRKNFDKKVMRGAPDFIAEILSPSNRFHDMFRKLNKYRFAGVREYWIIDPEKLAVIVYDLEHDEPPAVYSFDDTIPVLISGGECRIDFARIHRKVEKYL